MFSFVPPWADYPRFDEKSFLNVPHAEESILFTSGMAILDDPGNNAAVLDFFRKRRAEGARIVFDLNVRAESYGYEGERRRAMEEMIALSDIVLGSGPEEFGQVTGQTDLREAARILLGRMPGGISGHRAVIARDGGHPILVLEAGRPEAQNPEAPASREFCVEVKPVKPVSTLGAGDCFDAMFLFALAKGEGIGQAVRAASDHAGDYISGRI
jgi:sugar/nucleoside kinase (ribokinase family)